MSIDFNGKKCQDNSNKKLFGLCDDRPNERAYIDEGNGAKWIAIVVNDHRYNVTFTAIDHCIEVKREDGKMDKRCDGVLSYNYTIVFVELKERDALGNKWVLEGEKQLRTTISHYSSDKFSNRTIQKKAYIANKEHPKFKQSQQRRMDKFFDDTGFILRIENRIILQ